MESLQKVVETTKTTFEGSGGEGGEMAGGKGRDMDGSSEGEK